MIWGGAEFGNSGFHQSEEPLAGPNFLWEVPDFTEFPAFSGEPLTQDCWRCELL